MMLNYLKNNLPKVEMPGSRTPKILPGQKALVTGENSGIGKGIAKELAKAGADVVINYVANPDSANKLVDELKKEGVNSFAFKADVSNEDEVVKMFEETIKQFKTVDILINNAGLQRDSAFDEMTLEQWNKVISVNLTGQFLCAREAVKEFKRRGVKKEISCSAGKIIHISSVHEVIPWAGHANYAASKGGVMMLMKTIAQEVAPYRIRVNSICPGAIRTPINTKVWETKEAYDKLMKLIPYQRIGEPDDIGRVAAWLASDHADYINGTGIFVDGGMTLYPGFATGG
jgi:glucose 1-dehydrogenase